MATALIWLVTVALFSVGLVGTVVPFLPGIGFIFAGVLFYAWMTGWVVVSGSTVAILGAVTAVAWVAGYGGAAVGAKWGGGKKLAVVGAVLGSLVGLAFGPLGLLLGAFMGAWLGALASGQTGSVAARGATGAVLGVLGGAVVQLLLGIGILVAFFIAVLT